MSDSAEALEAILGLIVGGFFLIIFASATPRLSGGGIKVLGVVAIVGGLFLGVVVAAAAIISIME